MKLRRPLIAILAGAFTAVAIALGIPSLASADTKENFNNCLDAGGSVKACCAGVGGTYTKHPGGVETCVYINKAATSAETPPPTTLDKGNLIYALPPTGVLQSFDASEGQSLAGTYGIQEFVFEPVIILR